MLRLSLSSPYCLSRGSLYLSGIIMNNKIAFFWLFTEPEGNNTIISTVLRLGINLTPLSSAKTTPLIFNQLASNITLRLNQKVKHLINNHIANPIKFPNFQPFVFEEKKPEICNRKKDLAPKPFIVTGIAYAWPSAPDSVRFTRKGK